MEGNATNKNKQTIRQFTKQEIWTKNKFTWKSYTYILPTGRHGPVQLDQISTEKSCTGVDWIGPIYNAINALPAFQGPGNTDT